MSLFHRHSMCLVIVLSMCLLLGSHVSGARIRARSDEDRDQTLGSTYLNVQSPLVLSDTAAETARVASNEVSSLITSYAIPELNAMNYGEVDHPSLSSDEQSLLDSMARLGSQLAAATQPKQQAGGAMAVFPPTNSENAFNPMQPVPTHSGSQIEEQTHQFEMQSQLSAARFAHARGRAHLRKKYPGFQPFLNRKDQDTVYSKRPETSPIATLHNPRYAVAVSTWGMPFGFISPYSVPRNFGEVPPPSGVMSVGEINEDIKGSKIGSLLPKQIPGMAGNNGDGAEFIELESNSLNTLPVPVSGTSVVSRHSLPSTCGNCQYLS